MKASLSYPCSALIGLAQCRPIMAGDAAECTFFEKKLMIYLVGTKKRRTFALAFHKKGCETLGYGVMVTLQILVLSFLVRVRVPQQINPLSH